MFYITAIFRYNIKPVKVLTKNYILQGENYDFKTI